MVKECNWCQSKNLKFEKSGEYEDVMTNVITKKQISACNVCGTIHFKRNGKIIYDVPFKIVRNNILNLNQN